MSAQIPDEQHWLQGTRPTRAVTKEPTIVGGRPKMPKHLSPVARDKWKELVRDLSSRGTLTKADANALELYCETYAQWRKCLVELENTGPMIDVTVTDSSGESFTKRVQNPAQKLAVQLFNALRQMLKEFAITPASREKAKPAKPAAKKNEEPKPGTAAWYVAQEPVVPPEGDDFDPDALAAIDLDVTKVQTPPTEM